MINSCIPKEHWELFANYLVIKSGLLTSIFRKGSTEISIFCKSKCTIIFLEVEVVGMSFAVLSQFSVFPDGLSWSRASEKSFTSYYRPKCWNQQDAKDNGSHTNVACFVPGMEAVFGWLSGFLQSGISVLWLCYAIGGHTDPHIHGPAGRGERKDLRKNSLNYIQPEVFHITSPLLTFHCQELVI